MIDHDPKTAQLKKWAAGIRREDHDAVNEFADSVCARLERLTRKMLRGDPRVGRWEQTGDVLTGAFTRLLRALKEVTPQSRLHFERLAALQIRRELFDLAKHYYGPHGHGLHHASHPSDGSGSPVNRLADQIGDPAKLAEWTAFHEAVERLPEDEREVFELRYYAGRKVQDIAASLGVSEDTVTRRWQGALVSLGRLLGGALPEI